jgi:hypothetical protein
MSLLNDDLQSILTEGKIQAGMLDKETGMSQEDIQKLLLEGKIQAAMLQEDKKEMTQEDIQKMLTEGKIAAAILNQQEQEKLSNEVTQKDIDRYKQQQLLNFRATANEGGKFPDLNEDGKITQADILKGRGVFQEGGSMDDQMIMAMTVKPMESDDKMEDNYTKFIMEEALTEEEEDMLVSKLEQDEQLAVLFDKVIDVAQEFAGSGPVEGPGSGVSDSIPARLSDGEFVFTAKATEEIGADELMRMMKDAEAAADKRQGMAHGGTHMDSGEEQILSDIAKPQVVNQGTNVFEEDEMDKTIKGNMVNPNVQNDYVRS